MNFVKTIEEEFQKEKELKEEYLQRRLRLYAEFDVLLEKIRSLPEKDNSFQNCSVWVVTNLSENCLILKLVTQDVDQSRMLTKHLVLLPEIKKFTKYLDTWGTKPSWYWHTEVGNIAIHVKPAPPSKRCVPVEREWKYSTWGCKV